MLVLTVLMLVAHKNKSTFLAPIGIGLALFIGELVGVYYTGGSLNPARSFGPDVALATFEGYHWIYWLGPLLGATLAAGLCHFLKWMRFETVMGPEDDVSTVPAQHRSEDFKPSNVAGKGKATSLDVQGEERQAYHRAQPPPSADYDARLGRIEHLLENLTEHGSARRGNDKTLVGDDHV
ncbi:uncharacterized protein JCM6883_000817 [Sporobolomyces salmoneus]|uniref:uncharacterized protein n=1 Tax=Sporobolomyces salmoneus TaxID=183962 RepID=UPI00317541FE